MKRNLTGKEQVLMAFGVFALVFGVGIALAAPSLPTTSNLGIAIDTNGVVTAPKTIYFGTNASTGRSVIGPRGGIGVGTTTAPGAGNITATGTVTALNFVGDGSGLTGIAGGSGSGETNILRNASPTNNTTVFGLVSIKNGVTNFLKTLTAGANVTITDQGGTNLTAQVTNLNGVPITNSPSISATGVVTGTSFATTGGGAGGAFFSDTNGTTTAIGSAPLNSSNAFFNLPTNGNGGQTHAFWVSTLVSGTNYQLRPVTVGSGVAYETATSTLVATNVPDQAVISPRVTFAGPTNTAALNNGRQDFAMTTNCSITNVSGAVSGEYRYTSITASNSTPTTQHFYIPSGWAFFGTLTTNDFAVPSGKRFKLSIETIGTVQTNAVGLVQSN